MFRYNRWANRRLLAAMRRQDIEDQNILRIVAHALLAERIWPGRIGGQAQRIAAWDDLTLNDCDALATYLREGAG
ncbi:MAG TPA: hypothetical protein VKA53_05295 [Thermoanaerobaculia bacterium]|nr:hypothetical protein [Thermoanaerobaculia bacterium]